MTLKKVFLPLMLAVATLITTVAAAPVPGQTKSASVAPAEQHLVVARQAMKDGDYRLLEKSLKKAKKADPEAAEIYRIWGDYHAMFSRTWKADKMYKKAEELEKLHANKNTSGQKAADGQ